MNQEEAIALAAKREAHKGKHQKKIWTAAHDSVKGWHVAFVDPPMGKSAIVKKFAEQHNIPLVSL